MNASIIITTRNRAADLQRTLASFAQVAVPAGLEAELLVVDSASTDGTLEVARAARLPNLSIRCAREELPGQSRARNRGFAETRGEIILFTDDDVRPSVHWLEEMSRPIADGAHAVAGGVEIAPHLLRPWMTRFHRAWLASSEWLDAVEPRSLVGANMAFSRELLRAVPAFDPELGPGALGFGDDSLFARQVREAGFPIVGRLNVKVEHHFDPARLTRASWLDSARRHGQTEAYLTYHWDHCDFRWPRTRLCLARAQLFAWRLRNPNPSPEGCDERELRLVARAARLQHYLVERRRPRHYQPRGLTRVRPDGAVAALGREGRAAGTNVARRSNACCSTTGMSSRQAPRADDGLKLPSGSEAR